MSEGRPGEYVRYASPNPQPVQIEQTDKRWKLHIVMAIVVFVIGIACAMGDGGSGGVLLGIGVVLAIFGLGWFFVARYLAWWHHG